MQFIASLLAAVHIHRPVPWLIDREGKSKEVGYVAAIPEVADLRRFCNRYPRSFG